MIKLEYLQEDTPSSPILVAGSATTTFETLPSPSSHKYDNAPTSCNIMAKIKALPGIKKAHIKDMVELASSNTQSQQRRRRPRIRKRDPSRVPRPMNCFLAYRLEKQKQIASICPGTNHREISKIVAKWWSEESDEEKEKYRLIAEKDKQLHKEKYVSSLLYIYCSLLLSLLITFFLCLQSGIRITSIHQRKNDRPRPATTIVVVIKTQLVII